MLFYMLLLVKTVRFSGCYALLVLNESRVEQIWCGHVVRNDTIHDCHGYRPTLSTGLTHGNYVASCWRSHCNNLYTEHFQQNCFPVRSKKRQIMRIVWFCVNFNKSCDICQVCEYRRKTSNCAEKSHNPAELTSSVMKPFNAVQFIPLVWLDGRVVRTLYLRSIGRGFASWLPRCRGQPWASC